MQEVSNTISTNNINRAEIARDMLKDWKITKEKYEEYIFNLWLI